MKKSFKLAFMLVIVVGLSACSMTDHYYQKINQAYLGSSNAKVLTYPAGIDKPKASSYYTIPDIAGDPGVDIKPPKRG